MSLNAILTRLARGPRRGRPLGTARPGRARPGLEVLEDRCLLSVVLDHQHVEVSVNYDADNGWLLNVHDNDGDVDYDASEALMYAGPNTHTFQPDDPRFAFIGAGAGGDVWIMPQTREPDKIFMGFGFDGVDPGTFDTYFETDPRIQSEGEWIQVSLIDVRGPGQFSLWQTDDAGNPIVWMSTYTPPDGGNAIFSQPGDDFHANWGFTAAGCYQVDFQASAYLNGEVSASDVVTYNFGVEDTCGFGDPQGAALPPASPVHGQAVGQPRLTPAGLVNPAQLNPAAEPSLLATDQLFTQPAAVPVAAASPAHGVTQDPMSATPAAEQGADLSGSSGQARPLGALQGLEQAALGANLALDLTPAVAAGVQGAVVH